MEHLDYHQSYGQCFGFISYQAEVQAGADLSFTQIPTDRAQVTEKTEKWRKMEILNQIITQEALNTPSSFSQYMIFYSLIGMFF